MDDVGGPDVGSAVILTLCSGFIPPSQVLVPVR